MSVLALAALPLVALALAAAVPAQNLRHGVWSADVIVIAEVTGVRPLGDDAMLHTLRTLRTLDGDAPAQMTVVTSRKVSDQPTPKLGKPRIYCLKPARRVELPDSFGPYFRMTGFRGDHPLAPEDPEKPNTALRLVECLIASEANTPLDDTCRVLIDLAMNGEGPSRTEAVQVLRERATLQPKIDPLQRSAMLARAVGESKDMDYKIALASLCAELRMDRVIDALCMSLNDSQNEQFARALGRLAKLRHGEGAVDVLRPHIARARKKAVQDSLLLALGATQTESALDALLQHRARHGKSKATDAALKAHGSKRAVEAAK